MTLYNLDTTISTPKNESGPTIEYGADGIEIIINPGIPVVGRDDYAIYNIAYSGCTLINNGNVVSAGDGYSGAFFVGSIVNNAGGSISGYANGVFLIGADSELTNHGAISGLASAGVAINSATLNNDGEIWGLSYGARASNEGVINNSGSIRSQFYGVWTDANPLAVINNAAGGLIQGDVAGIRSVDDSRISLTNRGTVSGDIECDGYIGNVNDAVFNHGKIIGQVHLGLGNDSFKGFKGTSGKVFGEDGNDTLIGSTHDDQIDGGAGLDLIRGGRGKDLLFGGDDRDLFDFNSIKDSVTGSKRDQIMNFQHGNNVTGDDIDLSTIDAKTGVGGNQAFKFIGKQGFHDVKGELRYIDKGASCIAQGDVNGDGKADFEIFVKIGSLAKGDFLL